MAAGFDLLSRERPFLAHGPPAGIGFARLQTDTTEAREPVSILSCRMIPPFPVLPRIYRLFPCFRCEELPCCAAFLFSAY